MAARRFLVVIRSKQGRFNCCIAVNGRSKDDDDVL